jgi:hypothetical protein
VKRLFSLFLVAAALCTSVGLAGANPETNRIHRREVAQRERIQAGSRQGDLTRGERWRLRHGQQHIRRMTMRARRDGHMSRYERRHIERAQDRQSRRIYRLRHNHQQRSL